MPFTLLVSGWSRKNVLRLAVGGLLSILVAPASHGQDKKDRDWDLVVALISFLDESRHEVKDSIHRHIDSLYNLYVNEGIEAPDVAVPPSWFAARPPRLGLEEYLDRQFWIYTALKHPRYQAPPLPNDGRRRRLAIGEYLTGVF